MTVHGTMMQLSSTPPVSLNEGWEKLATLLKHLEDGLFGSSPDNPSAFTPTDFEEAHSLAYELCTPSLCGDVFRRLGIHFADVAQRAVANRKEHNAATYMRRMSLARQRAAVRRRAPREAPGLRSPLLFGCFFSS